MLRFAIHDVDGPAGRVELADAYLLGPDDIPARGEIKRSGDVIEVHKKVSSPVGLCVMYDAGDMGRLMLQTCLLPERKEPYVLALELARHRIKQFIAKSEEWQMFDLSAEHPAMAIWEESRGLFTQALIEREPGERERLGREALIKGIDASERLAMAHAEILLHRRYGNKPASSGTLGVRVWPDKDFDPLKKLLKEEFDVLVMPLQWNRIEVEEGVLNWDRLDRWITWAHKQGKPVVAGPLLDFSKRSIPQWMYVWQHDYETTRDLVYDYVEKVVRRYSAGVSMWSVARGLNLNDNFEFTSDQMMDLTRMTALVVKQARPKARVMIELAEPFGEAAARHRDAVYPLTFIERIVQEGIKLDCIGVQVLYGSGASPTRDLMMTSCLLDKFFMLERPVVLSALGAPAEAGDERSGWWREPWSPDRQARWLTRMFALAMSKPHVESFMWTDLFDHADAQLPHAGLVTESGEVRPVMNKLVGVRRRMRKPLGALSLPARSTMPSPG